MSKMVDLEKLKEWKQLKERIEQLEEEMGITNIEEYFPKKGTGNKETVKDFILSYCEVERTSKEVVEEANKRGVKETTVRSMLSQLKGKGLTYNKDTKKYLKNVAEQLQDTNVEN
jgi:DNA-binding ferritin-like protein (Dps family)